MSADERGGRARWGEQIELPAMRRALAQARGCLDHADVPVGAVVLDPDGAQVAQGRNLREATGDPTAHAEVVALRAAAAHVGSWRLEGYTMVVTLEPCVMCAGALLQARLARVVFAAWDEKAGACGSVWDLVRDRAALHRLEVVAGVMADEAAELLAEFFQQRR